MTEQQIAKTLVETIFAVKIVSAVKMKQEINQNDSNVTFNNLQISSLIILDEHNNIVNSIRSESQTVKLDSDIKVKIPKLNLSNLKSLTEYIVGLPVIEKVNKSITGFKNVTIKVVGNTYHVIDNKTKDLIATIKFIIPATAKQLVDKILSLLKKFYEFTAKNKLPFVLGLLGGFILSPFANKVLSVFGYAKNENISTYTETNIIDSVKTITTNIVQRLLGIVLNIYKKFTNVIGIIVSFIGGLILGSKDILDDVLEQFKKAYQNIKTKLLDFTIYITINVLKALRKGLFMFDRFLYNFEDIIELFRAQISDLHRNIRDYTNYLQIHKTKIGKVYPELVKLDELLHQNKKQLDLYLEKIEEVFSVDELLYHGYYSDQVLKLIETFSDSIKHSLDQIIDNIQIAIERLDKIEDEKTKKTSLDILAVLVKKLGFIMFKYLAMLRYLDRNALYIYEKRIVDIMKYTKSRYFKTELFKSLIATHELIKELQNQSIDKL